MLDFKIVGSDLPPHDKSPGYLLVKRKVAFPLHSNFKTRKGVDIQTSGPTYIMIYQLITLNTQITINLRADKTTSVHS